VSLTVDDAGGTDDSGITSSVVVVMGGAPVESLAVQLTTTTTPATPTIRAALLVGAPAGLSRACPAPKTIAAVVDAGTAGTPQVSATVAVNGTTVATVPLAPAALPPDLAVPPGPGYAGELSLDRPDTGTLQVTVEASNAAGAAQPLSFSLPIVNALPPGVSAPTLVPSSVPPNVRSTITVTARVDDDCRLRTVRAEADLGSGFRSIGSLRDRGRKGDAAAGDGLFTGKLKVRPRRSGTVPVRVTARNRQKLSATSPSAPLVVE